MINLNIPETAITEIITLLNNDFSKTNLETEVVPLFAGFDPKSIQDNEIIHAVLGPLFLKLKTESGVTNDTILMMLESILMLMDPAADAFATSLFFAHFCKYFQSNCMCFNDFTLKALANKNFDISLKMDEGAKNYGTAIGQHAKITGNELSDCLKPIAIKVKGNMLAYTFKALFDLTQDDFLTVCESYFELDLRIKAVGEEIKKLLDVKVVKNNVQTISDVICDVIKTWEQDGFNFCAKSLADFLIMHTKVLRDQYEDIRVCVYACLDVPAVRNAYLKIDSCTEIDLSQFVKNDNTSFVYTIDCSETKGEIALSKLHPPCAPLARYRIPEAEHYCEKFKDMFTFTVKNVSNNKECTAHVFLLHVEEENSCVVEYSGNQCEVEC